LFIYLEWYNI